MDSVDLQSEHAQRTVLAELEREVRSRGDEWFPGLATTAGITIVAARHRPRCSLYRVRLDGAAVRHVMVKVRRPGHGARTAGRRPMLHTGDVDGDRAGRWEYAGLQLIAGAVPDGDSRFGVVRPLAWLPETRALVMDDVRDPTLRAALISTSRLHPRRTADLDTAPWRHVGAWLRIFHRAPTDLPLTARNSQSQDAVELCERFREYVAANGRHSRSVDVLAEATAAAFQARPGELPLSTGHGDFAARNVFLGRAARVTVFDPMPRWRVPVYEDLARFLVGIRLLGLQATSHGLAFPRARLHQYEQAFLQGYFGTEDVPLAARAYTGLVLLDKWSALLAARGSASALSRSAAVSRLSEAYYAAEAGRLARAIDHGTGATSTDSQRTG